MTCWRAGCIERCKSGSEGGGWKSTVVRRQLAGRLPYNFAIRQSQLDLWLNLAFKAVGDIRVSGATAPRYGANLWIHPNAKGIHSLSGAQAIVIKLKGGMAVYPDENNPARIPIMGMRAITWNQLKLMVDGKNGFVDLKQGWL